MGTLPRVQAIEALHGFQNMKWVRQAAKQPSSSVLFLSPLPQFFRQSFQSRSAEVVWSSDSAIDVLSF